jgi:undecaprenyl-diphosphatase
MNPEVLSSQNSIFVVFLASFLIWFMFAGLLTLWVIDGRIKKEQVLHALLAAVLAWVTAMMLKSLLPQSRPFSLNGFPPLTFITPSVNSSFPSGHSAMAFGVAVSVWLHNRKIGIWFIVAAAFVGLGRIASNVHFYADVVGGAMIGVFIAYIVKRLHLFKMLS